MYGSDKVWHDVTVDAGNGKVLGRHVFDDASDDDDDDADDSRDRRAPRSASVSLDAAVDAALRAAPGTVTSIELDDGDDRRGGALHWDVDVRGKDGREQELNVDAKTSEVTADRSDDGDHDRHDDDRDGNDRDDDGRDD